MSTSFLILFEFETLMVSSSSSLIVFGSSGRDFRLILKFLCFV